MKVHIPAAGDTLRLAAPFHFAPAINYSPLLANAVGQGYPAKLDFTFPAGQEFTVLGVYMNKYNRKAVRLQTHINNRRPYVWMTRDEINQMEIK